MLNVVAIYMELRRLELRNLEFRPHFLRQMSF
jgi:hypothetical protein